MNLVEALKHGITQGDWTVICKIYSALTGTQIEPPKPKEFSFADIKIDLESEMPIARKPDNPHGLIIPTQEEIDEILPQEEDNEPDEDNYVDEDVEENAIGTKHNDHIASTRNKTATRGENNRLCKRVPFQKKTELRSWTDENLFPEQDVRKNPLMGVQNITPRGQRDNDVGTVNVTCRECHQSYNVAPVLVGPDPKFYLCNDCIASKASALKD